MGHTKSYTAPLNKITKLSLERNQLFLCIFSQICVVILRMKIKVALAWPSFINTDVDSSAAVIPHRKLTYNVLLSTMFYFPTSVT